MNLRNSGVIFKTCLANQKLAPHFQRIKYFGHIKKYPAIFWSLKKIPSQSEARPAFPESNVIARIPKKKIIIIITLMISKNNITFNEWIYLAPVIR